ncbi:MAG: nodulation protein NfeD [Anaerolineae bacterium]|nr:nodulation protein NfeD [Anaerolineae bacterium]
MNTKRTLKILLFTLLALSFIPLAPKPVIAQSDAPVVISMNFNGPLTPVWRTYLQRGVDQAVNLDADLIVIEINTPGGSVEIMNNLIQQILASPVPVAVYVAPRGAMAASAGTLIVLAGDYAAMSPGSVIGAASPVGAQGEDIDATMEAKTKEILKASARALAERRGADAVALAESSIQDAKAASANEALAVNMVDFIAKDVNDLLAQIDGQTYDMDGNKVVMHTANAQVVVVKATFIENLLGALVNPNIVFVLLSLGVQAILIELSQPGGWVAGFFGAILLALAGYGLGILPVNWFGLVLIGISFILFILDIKAPTHGALTVAGVVTFIIGALVLFNSAQMPVFGRVSVPLVIGMGVFTGATFFTLVMIAVRAMKTPVITGQSALVGRSGMAVTEINPTGIVQVAGERWSAKLAEGEHAIKVNVQVEVVGTEGLKVVVKKG